MYEQIYNLTCMFFKSLKGNLMYEFLISKFNGKRGPKRQLSLVQIVALAYAPSLQNAYGGATIPSANALLKFSKIFSQSSSFEIFRSSLAFS